MYVHRETECSTKDFFIFWLGLKPIVYESNICLTTIIDLFLKNMQKLFKIMAVVTSKIPYLS